MHFLEYAWSTLLFVAIGLLAGWLAGLITKGKGFGLVVNLIVGVLGALLGGFICKILAISVGGFLGPVVVATLGALLFLYLLKLIRTKIGK